MNTVTRGLPRTKPKVWVETLWLIGSIESMTLLREIPLRRGLNLILSEPMENSVGHGVGKTAFCQLLRFVLEDPQWATGTPLRDELKSTMPDGAVAARVHIGEEIWTVLKPWTHQKQYRAARDTDWRQLASGQFINQYEQYTQTFHHQFIEPLPVQTLLGSGQALQWQHILAWCSRDQGCRYQSYYHWRTEGTGFTLPAQSPALVVKLVLGLSETTTEHQLEKTKAAQKRIDGEIANLLRRSTDLQAHVKHQLAAVLEVDNASPFRAASLFDEVSLHGLAQQQIAKCIDEIQTLETNRKNMKQQRQALQEFRVPISNSRKALANEIAQLESAIQGNVAAVNRLKEEPEALQACLGQLCVSGDRLKRDCDYVQNRIKTLQFTSFHNTRERNHDNITKREELAKRQKQLSNIDQELAPLDRDLMLLKNDIDENDLRKLEILVRKKQLENAIKEYEFYEKISKDPTQWQDVISLKNQQAALETEQQQLLLQLHDECSHFTDRKKSINSLVDSIAKRLPGFAWGVFNEQEKHPFHMGPSHSTTYGVLETLTGDIVCLLDSRNPESFHPSFLLHDSPREAEMNESLFWALIACVNEAEQLHFQYIVTTSTKAPEAFEKNVRLRLNSSEEDGLLFTKRIGVEVKPLAI
ncbi:chromosome partitioning protein ParA [Agitococcus lubricus]|uniref:Chromosome segregation ATPase n=1 Tax=Agitococcus lubricus TaxID=1077255 RepID=A0A2T5ITN1_9GAMM|nr:chromosome partitioning protein ParA [Agitococcus lubricus]PTQ87168.1 hypothetical protein C8N29_1213 [Agitococcus lubricus]